MGEQSNAYRILLRYDRKSRHRRIKKQRRYERLAATSQFLLPSARFGAGIARTIGHRIEQMALHLTERFSAGVGIRPQSPLDCPVEHPQSQMQRQNWIWLVLGCGGATDSPGTTGLVKPIC